MHVSVQLQCPSVCSQQPGLQIVWRPSNLCPAYLQQCRNSTRNKPDRDQILGYGGIEVERTPAHSKDGTHDPTDHCQRMLQAQQEDQEQWNLVIRVEERWNVLSVAPVERPDVGREEV